MIASQSLAWGQSKSCIRELASYGAARKAEIGEDKVFDFSLGNPSLPPPPAVEQALSELLRDTPALALHGYTAASGLPALRKAIAEERNRCWGCALEERHIYVCCGAAAGLIACTRGLLQPGEQAIAFAPFFPEYRVFTESAGAELKVVPPDEALLPDLAAFAAALNEKTGLVIVNSPNNPSGVILPAAYLQQIAQLLLEAQEKYGHPIYLISDEPYRELVHDGSPVPCVFDFYDNSVVCYSFSKSLSLPGERIGYLAVSPRMQQGQQVFAALAGAARGCGYVNPPSLMQHLLLRCLGQTAELSAYTRNRDLLCGALRELGFSCVEPQGAFYVFVKSPLADAKAFSEAAKRYELLLVPSDDFGVTGYVRLACCVAEETIRSAIPAFRQLAEEFGLRP